MASVYGRIVEFGQYEERTTTRSGSTQSKSSVRSMALDAHDLLLDESVMMTGERQTLRMRVVPGERPTLGMCEPS